MRLGKLWYEDLDLLNLRVRAGHRAVQKWGLGQIQKTTRPLLQAGYCQEASPERNFVQALG